MGDGADMARERELDMFIEEDLFWSFPTIRNPFKLQSDFMSKGYVCFKEEMISMLNFQIKHNSENDIWFNKNGERVKISDMEDSYKNSIAKFLKKRGLNVPDIFTQGGGNYQ